MHQEQTGNTPYNIVGVRHATCLLLLWRVPAHVSTITRLSHQGLV